MCGHLDVRPGRLVGVEQVLPDHRPFGRVERGRLGDEGDPGAPSGVPRRGPRHEDGDGQVGDPPDDVRGDLGEGLDGSGDERPAAEQHLPGDETERLEVVRPGREPGEVDDDRTAPRPAGRGRGHRRPGEPGDVAQVDEPHAGVEAPGEGPRGGAVERRGRREQVVDRGVRAVVAEQVRGDPVGHPQGPGEEGPVVLLDGEQPVPAQRPGRRDPGPRRGRGRRDAAHREREAHRGPAPGHVVVEVAVEPLEAGVEVGGERDEEQFDVELGEPGGALQPAQPGAPAGGLGGGLGRLGGGGSGPVGVRLAGGWREEPVDVLLGQVQPAERVVRGRVLGPAELHEGPHPVLDEGEPGGQVRRLGLRGGRRRRGRRSHRGPALVRRRPRGGSGRPFRLGAVRLGALRLGVRPWTRPAPAVPGLGGRPAVAARALHRHPRRLLHRRAGLVPLAGVGRHDDDDVERRLELAAERGPHVGERAVLRGRESDRQRDGQPDVHRRRQHVPGDRVVVQQPGEHRGEQSVLVLRALRPRGDEVGELEVPRRQDAGDDPAGVVVLVDPAAFPASQVLSDVVEVDVDRRAVPPARPVLRRCVEHDVDVGRHEPVAADQAAQCLVHLVDHGASDVAAVRRDRPPRPGSGRSRRARDGGCADGGARSAAPSGSGPWSAGPRPAGVAPKFLVRRDAAAYARRVRTVGADGATGGDGWAARV